MILFFGIVFILGGFVTRFQINKREFNRRNAAGVEEFKSYGNAYGIKIIEKVGRLVGGFLIVVGILMTLAYFFGNQKKSTSHSSSTHKSR